MLRKIIHIDQEACNGCGACAKACHEGAIQMEGGKARLVREDYCDGLGDCLPACPAGAISFEEREAPAYRPPESEASSSRQTGVSQRKEAVPSQLRQWPVQLKLAPLNAPYFNGAELLVAADCTAYAYGNFHNRFIRGRVVLIGCPKLDGVDYMEKLARIITGNDIRSVIVVRMEVPCCGGLENAVKRAVQKSGKSIPCRVETVMVDGQLKQGE